MQVNYTYTTEPEPLRVYVDRRRNTHELTGEEAERAARRIARNGGYAIVVNGGVVMDRYGRDPRAI